MTTFNHRSIRLPDGKIIHRNVELKDGVYRVRFNRQWYIVVSDERTKDVRYTGFPFILDKEANNLWWLLPN